MSLPTDGERLAVLETEMKGLRTDVCDVKDGLTGLNEKIDRYLAEKADVAMVNIVRDEMSKQVDGYRKEVQELRAFVIKMVVGVGVFSATTLVGLAIFIVQQILKAGLEGM